MPIIPVTLYQAVCVGCGFDDFHDGGSCSHEPRSDVFDRDGVVLPDRRVYCYQCATPDDVMGSMNGDYYEDEEGYLRDWERWRAANTKRPNGREDVPEPLGWAHWAGRIRGNVCQCGYGKKGNPCKMSCPGSEVQ